MQSHSSIAIGTFARQQRCRMQQPAGRSLVVIIVICSCLDLVAAHLLADSGLPLTQITWKSERNAQFVGSPALVKLTDDTYLASHDDFGSGAVSNRAGSGTVLLYHVQQKLGTRPVRFFYCMCGCRLQIPHTFMHQATVGRIGSNVQVSKGNTGATCSCTTRLCFCWEHRLMDLLAAAAWRSQGALTADARGNSR